MNKLRIAFSIFFAVFFGASLTIAAICYANHWILFDMNWEAWTMAAALCVIGFLAAFIKAKEKVVSALPDESLSSEMDKLNKKMDRFDREFKRALRGHLKVSILFWIYQYRKEKVKNFEDAKNEVFKDLKREFPDLKWMESILEEIRQELSRYKSKG